MSDKDKKKDKEKDLVLNERSEIVPVPVKLRPVTRLTDENIMDLMATAVDRAFADEGQGETEGNNRGDYITAIGGRQGYEWCALAAGHWWRQSYELNGFEAPAWLFRTPGIAEPGARRLYNALWDIGSRMKDPALAEPGDLICWDREHGGHIALITERDQDDILHTMEGNVGKFPSKVKQLSHDVRREPNFIGIATLRRNVPLSLPAPAGARAGGRPKALVMP